MKVKVPTNHKFEVGQLIWWHSTGIIYKIEKNEMGRELLHFAFLFESDGSIEYDVRSAVLCRSGSEAFCLLE